MAPYQSKIHDENLMLQAHQIEHFERIRSILQRDFAYMDTSDMGCGKTFATMATALYYGLSIVLVSPKGVVNTWKKECNKYGVDLAVSLTYQSLCGKKNKPLKNGLLDKIDDAYVTTAKFDKLIQKGILLVFDEVHNLKNDNNQLSSALALVRKIIDTNCGSRIAALSATPFDKIECAESILKVLGIIKSDRLLHYDLGSDTYEYLGIKELLDKCRTINKDLTDNLEKQYRITAGRAQYLCYKLYKDVLKGYISSAMDSPKIDAEKDALNGYYYMSKSNANKLKQAISYLKRQTKYDENTNQINMSGISWGALSVALKIVEASKLEIFARLAKDQLAKDPKSKVIIYLNFIENMGLMCKLLSEYKPLLLSGKVASNAREVIMEKFQRPTDEYRIIIAHPKVGGVGISLDDRDGNWPRYMYVSPSYKFIELHQATGRIYRTSTKSKATIRFVYSNEGVSETCILNSLCKKAEVSRSVLDNGHNILFPGEYQQYIETA